MKEQDLNQTYKEYAAELGHLEFQMHLMQLKRKELLEKIEVLNKLAGSIKQTQETAHAKET